eukprot:TRINITY_DN4991_c0_g1_i1.p1 TRINITY_DN4991_c0_g1~~TRINITY_DN4991_c0_g1_i1.p1  ORF type:complete len:494 (+),score=106.81 TRINITY_DN4991_c0_g1_i1:36-1517(+)
MQHYANAPYQEPDVIQFNSSRDLGTTGVTSTTTKLVVKAQADTLDQPHQTKQQENGKQKEKGRRSHKPRRLVLEESNQGVEKVTVNDNSYSPAPSIGGQVILNMSENSYSSVEPSVASEDCTNSYSPPELGVGSSTRTQPSKERPNSSRTRTLPKRPHVSKFGGKPTHFALNSDANGYTEVDLEKEKRMISSEISAVDARAEETKNLFRKKISNEARELRIQNAAKTDLQTNLDLVNRISVEERERHKSLRVEIDHLKSELERRREQYTLSISKLQRSLKEDMVVLHDLRAANALVEAKLAEEKKNLTSLLQSNGDLAQRKMRLLEELDEEELRYNKEVEEIHKRQEETDSRIAKLKEEALSLQLGKDQTLESEALSNKKQLEGDIEALANQLLQTKDRNNQEIERLANMQEDSKLGTEAPNRKKLEEVEVVANQSLGVKECSDQEIEKSEESLLKTQEVSEPSKMEKPKSVIPTKSLSQRSQKKMAPLEKGT